MDRGADFNAIDKRSGESALSAAVGNGSFPIDIIRLLLDRGAEVTPLRVALQSGHVSMDLVELLLDRGSDMNASGLAAVSNGKCSIDIIKLLLERGADVIPLHVAFQYRRFSIDLVELLLERGSDINAKDFRGNTPLLCLIKLQVQNAKRLHNCYLQRVATSI